jgi:hypothetical protein
MSVKQTNTTKNAENKLVFVANVATPLSKQQKKFNDLVRWIQEEKDEMNYLKEVFPRVSGRIHGEINPEKKKFALASTTFLIGLDKQMDTVKLSAKDREALADYMVEETDNLISVLRSFDEDASAIVALFDKYSEESFAEVQEMKKNMANDMFGNIFKEQFGEDADFEIDFEKMESGDIEYIMEMQEKMQQAQERANQKQTEAAEQKAKAKIKTPKQLEKEAKAAEAKKKIEKNTRTIYFELAKKLHPDAIPDDEQKEWKTGLMQRLAVARDNDDLYEMLQIQIELQQSDDNALSKVGDETMSHYIKVLQDQLNTARRETVMLRESFPDFYDFFDQKNRFSEHKFKTEVNKIKKGIVFEQDRIASLKNPKWIKSLAKELIQMAKFDPFANFFGF